MNDRLESKLNQSVEPGKRRQRLEMRRQPDDASDFAAARHSPIAVGCQARWRIFSSGTATDCMARFRRVQRAINFFFKGVEAKKEGSVWPLNAPPALLRPIGSWRYSGLGLDV